MQIYKIETDQQGREVTTHGTTDFPCGSYDEWFSLFFNQEVPWHWHEEIEVVLVAQGKTLVQTTTQEAVISAGEIIFINSNVLHRLTQHGDDDCHILNAVFHPILLSGQSYNLIYKKQILPLLQNQDLGLFHFEQTESWQKSVILEMESAFKEWSINAVDKEMVLTMALMNLWQKLARHTQAASSIQKRESKHEYRLYKALAHLNHHYADNLNVSEIANAANMSESECYRMFRTSLGTTPIGYLTEHRLRLAAETICTTNKPIAEIADNVGFSCPAYFTKKFKQQFGMTPKAFRKAH